MSREGTNPNLLSYKFNVHPQQNPAPTNIEHEPISPLNKDIVPFRFSIPQQWTLLNQKRPQLLSILLELCSLAPQMIVQVWKPSLEIHRQSDELVESSSSSIRAMRIPPLFILVLYASPTPISFERSVSSQSYPPPTPSPHMHQPTDANR
ncbi:hypothetical protein ABVK25_008090 [Lepraria finkii]|uniref:Uncharacterized protein n=1 Tax=Lepraria finkii TaxID=1340010 RepID=A0ABR4B441_9LECA